MSYAPYLQKVKSLEDKMEILHGILGSVVGGALGGQLQNSQPGYTQQQMALAQQNACLSQLQYMQLQQTLLSCDDLYGKALAQYRPKSVFVPITQDEVDMAEAMYEVNKIAPGLREENQ